ncbi:MAG: SPASM domain-containing protein [Methanobrevibacter sp.]|jgi:radical SAM protein with 4Fe4S-binding SPASM domain|nr:SPASM domain-containing protein [Candidatus Methanovirga meridionalis]
MQLTRKFSDIFFEIFRKIGREESYINFIKTLNDNSNYKKNFEDVKSFLKEKNTPLFKTVEIETINRCNGRCSFCPVNKFEDTRKLKIMDEEMFNNIISQLKEIDYNGHIVLYSNNEPFLDKRLIKFIKIVKQSLPDAYHSTATNGTLLTIDKFKKIIDSLDLLAIDNYNDDLKLIKPVEKIYNYCLKNPEYQKKVHIYRRLENQIMDTRGGYANNRKSIKTMKSTCFRPFSQFIIRPTGEISLCTNDPLGKVTMGSLKENTMLEIWNNKKYQDIRQKLSQEKYGRRNIEICSKCDAPGYLLMFKETEAEILNSWKKSIQKEISGKNIIKPK